MLHTNSSSLKCRVTHPAFHVLRRQINQSESNQTVPMVQKLWTARHPLPTKACHRYWYSQAPTQNRFHTSSHMISRSFPPWPQTTDHGQIFPIPIRATVIVANYPFRQQVCKNLSCASKTRPHGYDWTNSLTVLGVRPIPGSRSVPSHRYRFNMTVCSGCSLWSLGQGIGRRLVANSLGFAVAKVEVSAASQVDGSDAQFSRCLISTAWQAANREFRK